MKSLRRSLNNNNHSSAASSSSSPSPYGAGFGQGAPPSAPSSVPAFSNPLSRPSEKVAPPQKVIKALASHKSTNPQELSYTKGDFWYVTSERDGWYEALNPLTGSRGLVPKDDFEEFTKGGRQTSGQMGPSSERARTPSQGNIYQPASARSPTAAPVPSSVPKRPSQPLYAIVQYDFHAERPDELDAKAGEPIVVIAQSNHEWFVAKPIGRLGGPGLIPVAFVEIRDPVTGKAIDVFPSSIPQVDEWKKATADYKAAAIPLGRFDLGPDQHVANSPYAPAPQQPVSVAPSIPPSAPPLSGGVSQSSIPRSTSASSVGRAQPSRTGSHSTARTGYRPEQDAFLPLGELVQLGVPSFHNESGNYWFRLHAAFIPDEPSEPAYTLTLYRTYEDFYDFQITLLDTFPSEAGRTLVGEEGQSSPKRILPYMPGPVEEAIDDELTEYRRDELDAYVHSLLALRTQGAGYILRHELIRSFFAAKYGDYCEEMPRKDAMEELEERLGDVDIENDHLDGQGHPPSSNNSVIGVHHMPVMARSTSSASHHSQASLSINPAVGIERKSPQPWNYGPSHTRGASRGVSPLPPIDTHSNSSHGRVPSTGTAGQGWTASPIATASSFGHGVLPGSYGAPNTQQPAAAASSAPPYVKIKIYDRATDDLIAIRVHPAVTHAELLEKVRARLGPEVALLRYRASMASVGASTPAAAITGGAAYREIRDDRELREWMRTEDQKLVLYAEQ